MLSEWACRSSREPSCSRSGCTWRSRQRHIARRQRPLRLTRLRRETSGAVRRSKSTASLCRERTRPPFRRRRATRPLQLRIWSHRLRWSRLRRRPGANARAGRGTQALANLDLVRLPRALSLAPARSSAPAAPGGERLAAAAASATRRRSTRRVRHDWLAPRCPSLAVRVPRALPQASSGDEGWATLPLGAAGEKSRSRSP